MMSYNTCPNLPSVPPQSGVQGPPENPQQIAYHLNVVQAKRRGLIAKEQMLKQKYKRTLTY